MIFHKWKMSWRSKTEQRFNSGRPIRKEELEYVAKSIRQRLHDGARYRDIRVLLGDVEAYQLQLKTIF